MDIKTVGKLIACSIGFLTLIGRLATDIEIVICFFM
jgi:hypothetical protein